MKSIDLSSVDLNLLVAFEALLAEQSVTMASQRLHIGQSAMSAALGRLRLLFEDDLFVRTGRQMLPTSRAQEIAPLLLNALNQIRQVLATPYDFDAATAQRIFRLGASDYLIVCMGPQLLQMATRVGITWDLTHFDKDHVAEVLERGGLDLALGTGFDLPAGILQYPLLEERLVGICRPGHPASQPGLSAADYAAMSHALFTLRQDRSGAIDRELSQLNLERTIVLTTPYLLVLPTIVASTELVAAVPSRMATYLQSRGMVEWFELPIPTETWMISMIWSKRVDQDPAHQWLRQQIQACFRQLQATVGSLEGLNSKPD